MVKMLKLKSTMSRDLAARLQRHVLDLQAIWFGVTSRLAHFHFGDLEHGVWS
jgi:hypothetical protein